MTASIQSPTSMPLGGPTINGTFVTVDQMTNPSTVIPPTIRNLVAANEGYFAERIFSTPGMTATDAIIYEESFPSNHFLDPNKTIAPRAPGSEAPRIAALRGVPSIARSESWSGSIEVTDEARRTNNVIEVQRVFRAAANEFADRIQTRAIETLNSAVNAWGRTIAGTPWDVALTGGVPNANPNTLPQRDLSLVLRQFAKDKTGIKPDTLIVHPDDAFFLDLIYGDKLAALLGRYGLTMFETIEQPSGTALFVKAGAVGVMAFVKPLDQEYVREGTRKTDVYVLEAVPIFVANDASAIIRLTGINPV
ncbi:MAG TPA: major capsid protein [Plantibacter sp.]|uniref:major capsid protein n=1 Tax=Plantibacter sp. TaxID=1871045 RepID=UPI002CC0C227|nr:major capsid protein [Plantibacter sp.]